MPPISLEKACGRRRFLIDTGAVTTIQNGDLKGEQLIAEVRRADLFLSYATLIECVPRDCSAAQARARVQQIREQVTQHLAEKQPDICVAAVVERAYRIFMEKRDLFVAKSDHGIGDAYNAAMASLGDPKRRFVIVTEDPDYPKLAELDWLDGWIKEKGS